MVSQMPYRCSSIMSIRCKGAFVVLDVCIQAQCWKFVGHDKIKIQVNLCSLIPVLNKVLVLKPEINKLLNILRESLVIVTLLLCSLFTSAGVGEFSSAQEAQVSRPRPYSLCVTETQFGAEVISVQRLLTINRVISCCIVGAANPDLFSDHKSHFMFRPNV